LIKSKTQIKLFSILHNLKRNFCDGKAEFSAVITSVLRYSSVIILIC